MKDLLFILILISFMFFLNSPVLAETESDRPAADQLIKNYYEKHKKDVPSQEMLKKRISTYWESLIKGDLEKAFKFIRPKARTRQNRLRFSSDMENFTFLNYEIKDITIKENYASVRVKRTFKVQSGIVPVEFKKPISQTLTDQWIFTDGDWHIVLKKTKPLFPESRKETNTAPGRQRKK